MLARRKIALLDGALVAEALGALQEKFGAFATSKEAYGAGVTCHEFLQTSDDSRFTLGSFIPAQ